MGGSLPLSARRLINEAKAAPTILRFVGHQTLKNTRTIPKGETIQTRMARRLFLTVYRL